MDPCTLRLTRPVLVMQPAPSDDQRRSLRAATAAPASDRPAEVKGARRQALELESHSSGALKANMVTVILKSKTDREARTHDK
jgi:hypothetical protein